MPTRQEAVDSLELVARREVWPIVTGTYPLDATERVHQRPEEGPIIGRAALIIGA